jgi:hypothetical protein
MDVTQTPGHQLTVSKASHRTRQPAERGKVNTSSIQYTDNELTMLQGIVKRSHLSHLTSRRKEGVRNKKKKKKTATATLTAKKGKTFFRWRMNPGLLGREGIAFRRRSEILTSSIPTSILIPSLLSPEPSPCFPTPNMNTYFHFQSSVWERLFDSQLTRNIVGDM